MPIITNGGRSNCGCKGDCDCCNNITINCGSGTGGVDQSCIDMRNQLALIPQGTPISVSTTAGQTPVKGDMGTITGFTFTVEETNGVIATINICQVAFFET